MLYTPGEICKKIDGLTVRVIADLAEKKFILPVKDTSGPGTARLYDKDGVFRIMLYAALRGGLPRDVQVDIIKQLMEMLPGNAKAVVFNYGLDKKGEFIYQIVSPNPEGFWITDTWVDDDENLKVTVPDHPKGYIHTVINISGMREFIDKNFQ